MPVFLRPAWLVALAALAIPLAIHLWNRRPRQTVRLGSLDFLAGRYATASWGRRFDELPLLLLRMTLLAIVAAALADLAGPPETGDAAPQSPVVLVDPRLADDSLALFSNSAIDSLRRRGASFQLLSTDHPPISDRPNVNRNFPNLWASLIQFDQSTPLSSTVVVATIGLTRDWMGPRPSLRNHYRVVRIDAASNVDTMTAAPNLMVRQTHIGSLIFREPLSIEARDPAAAPEGMGPVTIVVDQDDDWEASAWRAAVEAITLHLWDQKAVVLTRRPHSGIEDGRSIPLVIWLSETEPDSIEMDRIAGGGTMLRFPSRRIFEAAGNTVTGGLLTHLIPETIGISIRRVASVSMPADTPLLLDGFGTPIISEARIGSGRIWRFATRVDPIWSDLALPAVLPRVAGVSLGVEDNPTWAGRVSARQLTPTPRPGNGIGAPQRAAWSPWLFLAAAIVMMVERVIAYRRDGKAR